MARLRDSLGCEDCCANTNSLTYLLTYLSPSNTFIFLQLYWKPAVQVFLGVFLCDLAVPTAVLC